MEGIDWPPRLLLVLRRHLEQLEHPEFPRTPPLTTAAAQQTVLSFLLDAHECAKQLSKLSEPFVDCCQNLVLDTIEQCCASSFLSSRERRVINLLAVQREKRSEGRLGQKRRHSEKAAAAPATSSHKCAAVLPLEYLLRFFLALPSILAHYDKLGGATMPASYKQPLWDYVNAILSIMKGMEFVDPAAYVLLK
ncbi:uncharacterized protein Tco025E_07254 [Trypanosoma conorhini]|uniref:Uncharacterized protein n=1 Tax=Trypanosoma conorhini TaxID=83891 RepID=A0A3R7KR21_9TRYP|nr:uncharacterized protein Tco025E_07254 [Trypanosoma conorhini]RNF08045.1 hypothetical protein Tco025E_07254 [Trypanosoma conorhini]